jgi:acetyl esterase/lipase
MLRFLHSRNLVIGVPLLCVIFLLMLESGALSQENSTPFSKTTHTYKTVDELEIQADVYRHEDAQKRPIIVWLHGGALIMGTRSGVPQQVLDLSRENGFVIVSLDYRLLPEAKLPDVIKDLEDGLQWVRESGPTLFNADPSRMVVAGASAGGYLALMSGISVEPPPTAIVSYWGFGDVVGDWTTKPSESYRRGSLIEEETALAGVGEQVLTNTDNVDGPGRSVYFVYLKQTGRWLTAAGGLDPEREQERIDLFCPIRNVSPEYPPTLFLHGDADIDVPVGQSLAMADELKRHGVDYELIVIEGGGHSLWGGDPVLIDQAFARSMEYIQKRLTE